MEELVPERAHRAPAYGRPAAVAAKVAMRPFNEQMTVWQRKVALMRGAAESTRGGTSAMFLEARALEIEIMFQLEAHRRAVDALDEKAALHSRILDTERALKGILRASRDLQKLMSNVSGDRAGNA